MIGDPDTIAIIYDRLGRMGDNGGFDPATVEAMKQEYPEYITHIDVFIRTLTVNRLAGLIADLRTVKDTQDDMSAAQLDLDIRLCTVEDTTQKTLEYVIELVQNFTDERDAVIARQNEHEARAARHQARRDKLMVASVPVIVTIIDIIPRLLGG